MSRSNKSQKWFAMILAIVACLALSAPARADTTWLEEEKLLASDAAEYDQFGQAVAISGDFAIVGAYWDDDNGTDSGSAYIFRRDGTSWVQQAKLIAPDGDVGDQFGQSVAICGDFAIVGAYTDDDNGINSGSAYIFSRNGDVWVQQAKLLAPDGEVGDWFSNSVAITGDFAIVGACRNGDSGTDSGSAYIFSRSGTVWSQQAKLLASDGAADDWFGFSVSISADYAIVGAYRDDDNGTDSGSAYIFKRDGTVWSQQAKLLASDGEEYDWFGGSVAISGDSAIVGACKDNDNGTNSGSAYIFRRDSTVWTQQAKIRASDATFEDWFGCSVSISGDFVIAGAYSDSDNGEWIGSAYIFRRDGTAWNQQDKLLASDGAVKDLFGVSVAISGNFAIVGAIWDDDNGTDSGSAYVFVPSCAHWLTADLNSDCFVDFEDFTIFASQWLKCGDPYDPNCQP